MMRNFLSLAILALALGARAAGWFDAGIAGYAAWPLDGADFAVPGGGVWSNTRAAALQVATSGTSLAIDSPRNQALRFTAAQPQPIAADEVALTMRAAFTLGNLPAPDQTLKGAVMVVGESAADCTYYALMRDAAATTNVWAAMTGPLPRPDELVTLVISFRTVESGRQVRYAIDGLPLTREGLEWLPIVFPGADDAISGVDCKGVGRLATLAGASSAEAEYVTLTIPDLEGIEVAAVQVAGTTVAPEADGSYRVQRGMCAVVGFAAKGDLVLDASTMVFLVTDDMELPEEGRPHAVDPMGCLAINEVMASNGDTLATTRGKKGLDWIELHNSADFDLDVTGWYLADNPGQPSSKWTKIEGRCIVPAHGYAIVWADSDWSDFAPREAYVRIGLSKKGETVFLATPGGRQLSELAFGQQFKDVSYGVGVAGCGYFRTPTPGAANVGEIRGEPTPKVVFSEPHGYKTEPFTLTLGCPEMPEAAIYFTTNGTSPSVASLRYEGPITVLSSTVVRAAVPMANSILQRDVAATYLFVDDILAASGVPANFPASGAVNGQVMGYGMNSSLVSRYRSHLCNGFTNGIATISLVIDPANLFNASTGIYVNARKEGREWERATMVEMFSPTNAAYGFSVPAGVRIRGACSTTPSYRKHSLRLFFRDEYGMGKLEYPLFENDDVAVFDRIDLRTSQNVAWVNGNDKCTFIEDVFSRDTQRDLGESCHHSRSYHLFLNGVYWGLYQTEERTCGEFGETHFGGTPDDYDVVRTSYIWTSSAAYVTGVVEGEETGWRNFWDISVNQGYGSAYPDNYNRVRGLNPDGTRNLQYPIYLNPRNVAVLMLGAHFATDVDSPSAEDFPNNMAALWHRHSGTNVLGGVSATGWIFHRHDCEHGLGMMGASYTTDRLTFGTEAYKSGFRKYANFNPAELHYKLEDHPDYRMLAADLMFESCVKETGALTPQAAERRFRARMDELGDAISCEAARWGGGSRTAATWTNACNNCLNWITNRTPYLVAQYRAKGWYPSIDAPRATDAAGAFLHDGDVLEYGAAIHLSTVAGGSVYFTTNGVDPRLAGGTLAASAATYAGAITVGAGAASLRARARSASGEWSALEKVDLAPSRAPGGDALARGLRVCEVMSCSADADGDGAEFIVFTNLLADATLDLAGVRVCCTKTGNAAPSLELMLAGDIPPGGTATFTKAADWPTAKITNGKMELVVYDSFGAVVQTVHLETGWLDSACDGTGASFVAHAWGTTVADEAQWEPSFRPPANATGAKGVRKAIAADDAVRRWINALARTESGAAEIAAFAGTQDAVRKCYLVNGRLESEPEVELEISALEVDGQGVKVGGRLWQHGVEQARAVNGTLRLYYAETLQALSTSTTSLSVPGAFPLAPVRLELPQAPVRFFQLRIE